MAFTSTIIIEALQVHMPLLPFPTCSSHLITSSSCDFKLPKSFFSYMLGVKIFATTIDLDKGEQPNRTCQQLWLKSHGFHGSDLGEKHIHAANIMTKSRKTYRLLMPFLIVHYSPMRMGEKLTIEKHVYCLSFFFARSWSQAKINVINHS